VAEIMKPFNFRLDKILDYRSYLMKRAQVDLSNARYECERRIKEIGRLAQQRTEVAKQCNDEGIKGMDVARYQIFQAFLQALESDLEKTHIRLQEGQEQVREKEAVLKKASIKKKALESLKDMQHKKYMESSEREAQKVLDEIVITGRESRI